MSLTLSDWRCFNFTANFLMASNESLDMDPNSFRVRGPCSLGNQFIKSSIESK